MKDISDPTDCPDCGHAVAAKATICPSCGAPLGMSLNDARIQRRMRALPVVVGLGMVVFGLTGGFGHMSAWVLVAGLILLGIVAASLMESRQGSYRFRATWGNGVALPYGLNLTECRECGHALSLRAAACPSCGVPPPRSKTRQRAWAILFTGMGLSFFGGISEDYAGLGVAGIAAIGLVGLLLFLVGVFLVDSDSR